MKVKLTLTGIQAKALIVEPWGEEFDIASRKVEIVFRPIAGNRDCHIEMDQSEDGFVRIENPSGFRPVVLIDGQEDERSAFAW